MGRLANIKVRIEEWWHNYQKDVAKAQERQKMLRVIRDKSYAQEKGVQDAKTEGHRAREAPREYSNSLFASMFDATETKDAVGTLKPVDAVGNVKDIFKELRKDAD